MAFGVEVETPRLHGVLDAGGRDDLHATGLKSEGLTMQDLFSAALGRTVHLQCLEDNTTAISAARAGYSPALRHLPWTERISVGVLYEVFVERDDCTLQYQPSGEHKGDMFTKRLGSASFEIAIARANTRRMRLQAAIMGGMSGMSGDMNMIFKIALPSPGGLCCSCTCS